MDEVQGKLWVKKEGADERHRRWKRRCSRMNLDGASRLATTRRAETYYVVKQFIHGELEFGGVRVRVRKKFATKTHVFGRNNQ